jgi:predicted DNA-binding transcriptional regulator AlpA
LRDQIERPRYISEKEVSAITGLSLQTLRNYRSVGKGPTYCKIGRAVRYPLSDLLSYMDARKVMPRLEAPE